MAKTSMYAIDRSEEYLAHYGIKGMKWGVRKAIASGGTGLGNRKLARQYKKAQKKLAKLEKRANNGAKYARRAAALGAGAAAAGGLAALGTGGVGSAIHAGGAGLVRSGGKVGKAIERVGGAVSTGLYKAGVATGSSTLKKLGAHGGQALTKAGKAISKASTAAGAGVARAGTNLRTWGNSNSIGSSAARKATDLAYNTGYIGGKYQRGVHNAFGDSRRNWRAEMIKRNNQVVDTTNKMRGVSNNQIARAGAAALGLGLAGAAGYNAYRAATTKRAAKKAAEFRREMNKTFAGTAYGSKKSSSNAGGAKKRRRR